MAPEAPGNLLVADTRFDGDKLTGFAETVDYTAQQEKTVEASGRWLDVYWNGIPAGEGFLSLGRGVVCVAKPPDGYTISPPTKITFDVVGDDKFALRDTARGEGFMFVLLLPKGSTLTWSEPWARSAKVFRGRLALYWKPDGRYNQEVVLQWKLGPVGGNIADERNRINREIYSGKNVPTNAGTSIADRRIFIGHGHSETWRVLKDFLSEKLGLPYEEFNRRSVAGYATKERLEEMLDSSTFAFLVMTGDDQQADSTRHARENVVHEIGLFQGRYGFERAIVLREDGCEEFSNIRGVTQIFFPKGNILAVSEQIRDVLVREGLLNSI
jgi:predicted nucleotide-binding protein